jgi:hypothetical protein
MEQLPRWVTSAESKVIYDEAKSLGVPEYIAHELNLTKIYIEQAKQSEPFIVRLWKTMTASGKEKTQ